MRPIIRVQDVSKSYQLGMRQNYATVREEIVQALQRPFDVLRGKRKPKAETLWALKI